MTTYCGITQGIKILIILYTNYKSESKLNSKYKKNFSSQPLHGDATTLDADACCDLVTRQLGLNNTYGL